MKKLIGLILVLVLLGGCGAELDQSEAEEIANDFIASQVETAPGASLVETVRHGPWWESTIALNADDALTLFIDPESGEIGGLECPNAGYVTYADFLTRGGDGNGCWLVEDITAEVPVTATPTQQPPAFVPTFAPGDCAFSVPAGAQERIACGYVTVPLHYDDPGGETIRLAVVRIKAEAADPKPDPVILLSGGPGEKTVANAITLAQIMAPHFPDRDFILFDQRGVGLSQPALECPEWIAAQIENMSETDYEAILKDSFDAFMACRDRLVAEGVDLTAFNTIENAHDVESIRAALGYERLNLLGGSYGSYLGQQVTRQHPESLRSVVLAAVWPLEQSFFVGTSETTSAALLKMIEACSDDAVCNEAYPNLKQVLFDEIDVLNNEPVPLTLTDPETGESMESMLTGHGLVNDMVNFLYITPLIPSLPQAIYDVKDGDYQLIAKLEQLILPLFKASSRGMMLSVVCTEDLVGVTPEDYLAERAKLPPQLRGDFDEDQLIQYGIFGICENWHENRVDPSFKQPLVSDVPTLLLEGELDPVTPLIYAEMVAEHLDEHYVYELPGIGHNVLVANPCSLEIVADFIDDPSGSPDVSCIANLPELAFDLPTEPVTLTLEPFSDESRGFSGLVPSGWQERAPANLVRGASAIDPAYFVLEAVPGTQEELTSNLMAQLGQDPAMTPEDRVELGHFTWDLYAFSIQGNPVDVALTADEDRAYFVLLISPPDEHTSLYEGLYLPAVKAMRPYGVEEEPFGYATPESQGVDGDALSELVDIVSSLVEEDAVVGAELAVIKNRKLVLHEAFGWQDRERDLPLQTGSLYNIRSMTKPVLATVVLMLAEAGELSLDDPVAQYLPAFDTEELGDVTIRHLLTHRSGLPLSALTTLDDVAGLQAVAEGAAAAGLEFEPGTDFQYSDAGSDTLGAVVEVVTGKTMDGVYQEYILDRLGMSDTVTLVSDEDSRVDRIVSAYAGVSGNWSKYWEPADGPLYTFTMGSQSLYAPILDYARFLAMWMDGGVWDGERLLDSETVSQALSPASADAGLPGGIPGMRIDYGQMWMIYMPMEATDPAEMVLFSHNGSDGTWAWAWPDQNLMVFYFTQSRGQGTGISLEWDIDRLLVHPDSEATDVPADLEPYLGDYTAMSGPLMYRPFQILVRNGQLIVNLPEQIMVELLDPDEDGLWRLSLDPSMGISFVRDDAGEVVAMNWHQHGEVFEVPRGVPPDEEPLNLEAVQKYLGLYERPEDPAAGPVEVLIHNDHLAMKIPEVQIVLELFSPDEEGHWVMRLNPSVSITFEEDEEGNVISFTSHAPDGSYIRPRLTD